MKIYIAGPMSGLPEFNRRAFWAAEAKLWDAGHIVLNPANLPDGLTEAHYMNIGIAMLCGADGIFMLSGWEKSAGAKAEHALAQKLDLEIIHQENAA